MLKNVNYSNCMIKLFERLNLFLINSTGMILKVYFVLSLSEDFTLTKLPDDQAFSKRPISYNQNS